MKTYLLPKEGTFYKANLHCHSVISDGKLTVEELKELYMNEGYSIIAYTDHEVFIPHNELTDDNFLALNAYEVSVTKKIPSDSPLSRTCHMCFISLDKNRVEQSIYYDCTMYRKNEQLVKLDKSRDFIVREYTPEFINGLIKQGVEDGFFVTYNHPVWSLETKDEYCSYHGMQALEIVNYGSLVAGFDDRNPMVYDEMLRGGEQIFCVATDDNHNYHPAGHEKCDSCGGFTMIKADALNYDSIADALRNGSFYASEAPLIEELWYEDGTVHIRTSEAVRIFFSTGIRRAKAAFAEKGKTITEASFEVKPNDIYFRLTVFDKEGKAAYSNAYYLKDLPIENA